VTLLVPALAGLLAAAAVMFWTGPAAVRSLTPSREVATSTSTDGTPATAGTPGGPRRASVREDLGRWLGRLGARSADRTRDLELRMLDGLAAALEAGLPVPRAVVLAVSGAASSARPSRRRRGRGRRGEWARTSGWDELARAAAQGQALAPVWQRLARREGSQTLSSVARAWRVAALTGAPLARAVRVSAHVCRERRRLERAVQVATAGARATVTVLTLLPLAGVGLAAVLGVPPLTLYSHPLALAGAGAGAVLTLVGQLWSRRLVSQVVRGVR
jgi:tight adherence protein B